MAIDFEITARLAKIAEKFETLAGITPDAGSVRDTTITSRLKRIEDAIVGGALSAHTLGSHPDVDLDSPVDGEFLRYDATAADWINSTAALKDLSDVNSSLSPPVPPPGGGPFEPHTTILGWDPDTSKWTEEALYINELMGYHVTASGSIGRQFVLIPASDPLTPPVDIAWGQVPVNLYALLDVDIPSPPPGAEPADDDLLQYDLASSTWKNVTVASIATGIDHGGLVGLTDDDHIQYLLEDGTRPLSGNWITGDFLINAGQLAVIRTGLTSNFTAFTATMGIADSVGGGVWSGFDLDIDYDYSAGGVSTTSIKGINLQFDMTVSGGGSVLSSPTALEATITIPSATFFVANPAVKFDITNNSTSLGFPNGAMDTLLTTAATTGIAQRSAIKADSASASSIQAVTSYSGFADGFNLYTGNTVGVHAQTANNTAANGTFGFLSTPSFVPDSLTNDKRLVFKGVKGSLMLETGNIIVMTSGSSFYSRPADVSTTHLNFLNWGQLYIESDAEFDGTVYCDDATLGWRAVADCHLDAANAKMIWGSAQECSIYFDGSDMVIEPDENTAGANLVINEKTYITPASGDSLEVNNRIFVNTDAAGIDFGATPSGARIAYNGTDLQIFPKITGTGVCRIVGDLEIDEDLDHDGTLIGFFGTIPVAQSTGWSTSNVSSAKTLDADSVTLHGLADIVGTLVDYLLTRGDLGA